jgi:hypothetical protein
MGASSGGYKVTVQSKMNAVDESTVHGGGFAMEEELLLRYRWYMRDRYT